MTSDTGTAVETERGLVYGPSGKRLDLYRPAGTPGPAPTVLLWHGAGPDERDVLAPLARTAAARGLLVLVPDWRPDAADGGRGHLLESLCFVRKEAGGLGGDGESFALAGWSAGAGATLGVALRPEVADGWRPSAVVGLAGRYDLPARTTGSAPLTDLAAGLDPAVPVHLVHGSRDVVLDARHSRDLAEALRTAGRPAALQEPATDHAGVIMTEFDPTTNRCVPTTAAHAVEAGRLVAGVLTEAAGGAVRAGRSS
ncbi:alpha/beta hydrolase [Streptomyces sp. NPDC059008]|uniref:alpha/beta hydrolase n=1 Tax=Streptomyces sp. NPDC059008 TaxID=3346693 RepID=UPI003698E435